MGLTATSGFLDNSDTDWRSLEAESAAEATDADSDEADDGTIEASWHFSSEALGGDDVLNLP
jgi:hypothetical protein